MPKSGAIFIKEFIVSQKFLCFLELRKSKNKKFWKGYYAFKLS